MVFTIDRYYSNFELKPLIRAQLQVCSVLVVCSSEAAGAVMFKGRPRIAQDPSDVEIPELQLGFWGLGFRV